MATKLTKHMDELEELQTTIAIRKAELKELEEQEAALYDEIMPAMRKQGLEMVRTTSGLTYYINPGRVSFGISKHPGMREQAVQWAMKEFPGILTISAGDLAKVCKPMMELPPFVERKEGEPYLAVRN